MKLLVQPCDGILPVLEGIESAKDRLEIVIFRCDLAEVEKALAEAVSRGVHVHALITYTNRGGEKSLRRLELRLLAAGVTVARTADNLARYHDKLMIIDRRELYVLAFNFTRIDIRLSRSFGLITRDRALVEEAVKLFEADVKRLPYTPGLATFLVSPENARTQLASFIKGARKQLLIYDPEVSDPTMIRLLQERSKAGVDIRILGRAVSPRSNLTARQMLHMRLHTRTILRDGQQGFIGSQSLRRIELDARREVGIIFRDARIVSRLATLFEDDWALTERTAEQVAREEAQPAAKVAKRVAKAIVKVLPPVTEIVEVTVKKVVGPDTKIELNAEEIEETVRDAVKDAVKQVVKEVVGAGAK